MNIFICKNIHKKINSHLDIYYKNIHAKYIPTTFQDNDYFIPINTILNNYKKTYATNIKLSKLNIDILYTCLNLLKNIINIKNIESSTNDNCFTLSIKNININMNYELLQELIIKSDICKLENFNKLDAISYITSYKYIDIKEYMYEIKKVSLLLKTINGYIIYDQHTDALIFHIENEFMDKYILIESNNTLYFLNESQIISVDINSQYSNTIKLINKKHIDVNIIKKHQEVKIIHLFKTKIGILNNESYQVFDINKENI
jgi:hypothetical protein